MAVSTPSSNLGRHIFGAAALASGLITLAWRDYNGHQLHYIVYAAAVAQIVGGALIQFRRSAKAGAAVLGAAYLVFVLLCVPQIITAPQIYNSWGNFFEQFSLLTGAAIVLCALGIGMVTWNAESDWTRSFGHLYRLLCPRTGVLYRRYRQSCAEVDSAKSDVLGANHDDFVRTRGSGSPCESNGASRGSPADGDDRELWTNRVDTASSFASPQSHELERNRRDLRDCRSSLDSG